MALPHAISQGTARGRGLAVAYYVAQAVLAVFWWVSMASFASVRARFELNPNGPRALDAFLVADLVVFVAGSLASAWAISRRSRRAGFFTAFTAGGVAYATLYLLSWVALEETGTAGVAPMVAALVASTVIALDTSKESDDESRSPSAS